VVRLPRISIVTPSYNQGDFIRRTADSILNQGYPDLEYIVMDGGSSDGTVEILKEYGSRITWFSEKDRGQAHAINKGLQMATGDVVAYVNSDDELEPGALWHVGRRFAARPEIMWATGKCRIIDRDGTETRKLITRYKNAWLAFNNYSVLLILNYISQPATFWRRQALDTVGYFDESLHYTLDYDYWLRLSQQYRLHVIHHYLARFRVHPSSKGGTAAPVQFDSELAVAKRYMRSGALIALHRLHAQLIVTAYARLLGHSRSTVSS
jgi:glycosyltransferase involved in cell wall biosynthesis